MKPEFKEAIPVLEKLEEHGFQAFFVGGSVRDSLLNRTIDDVDIATNATPEQVQKIFDKTIPIGIEHGTVIIRYHHISYEVTTFRTESDYIDFRHPESVEFVKDIHEDLSRRDFTMNAIAMDKDGRLIDPYEGQIHMNEKRIETVRNADERFQEDPLRMMRALRFVSQLGFHLGKEAEDASFRNRHLLEKIAVERIAAEMEKLWKAPYILKALTIFHETDIWQSLPVFKQYHSLIQKCLSHISSPFYSLAEAIACMHLFYPTVSIDDWCKRWKLSKAVKHRSYDLINGYQLYRVQGLTPETLYRLRPELFQEFVHLVTVLTENSQLTVREVERAYHQLPIKNRNDLNINGHEMKRLYPDRKPGPWVREWLDEIERQVINGNLQNEKQTIMEWVEQWNRREKN
ncbi:CCA tRNA nucleotidyltransferase [Virgibacillus sp. MSP4-1]|uniref:CCA tRNA nucleotidyltransferase n=1 Tax=Virgibacillus sp. MSP4-1 TaxID=2700081 RepID=UPI00039CD434|nr:CCA tRNA nucleotidyltransferase [Virgibacillus sp. MSP4-1]QHS22567.1 CCA tRNA nucleotidyltransferase [Virgibacillus sp. MSP4-1]